MSNTAGKKKGSKLKLIIVLAIIAVIVFFVVSVASGASMMSQMTMASTVKLEKKNIENTVSVSGMIESQTFQQVGANLQYNVETVNVEVGDKVKKGDILATLNSDDLQDQIVQQQASLDSSNINTEYSLSDAEKRYNEAQAQIADGSYPEIRNAKMNLDNAQDALEKAQKAYDDQLEMKGTDKDSQLFSAQKNVESAKFDLDYAKADLDEAKQEKADEDYSDIKDLKEAYDDAKKEFDSRYSDIKSKEINDARAAYDSALSTYTYLKSLSSYSPESVSAETLADAQQKLTETESTLKALEKKYDVDTTEDTYEDAMEAYNKAKADIDSAHETKLENAQRSYDRAKVSYENAVNTLNSVKNGNDTSLESCEQAVKDAQKSVDSAKESYELAVKNAESTLASYKASADREKVLSENDAQMISLEILKEKLDDCVITAPCDGTITAVNAIEGNAASGVLFIIEDTDNLKMTAYVKEYAISELKPGLEVKITVPSLNSKEFTGVIKSIPPASTKDASGRCDGNANFGVEIDIRDTKDSGVLIGMNSKCTAVTSSAENVFAVGYDCLVEDADGSCYIFTAEEIEGGSGTATAKKIPVEVGFESDAELEIISPELTEGMSVITNAGGLTDGSVVILADAFGAALESAMAEQQ